MVYKPLNLGIEISGFLSDEIPPALGSPAAGIADAASRADHVHPSPIFVIPTAPIENPPIGFAYIDLVAWQATGEVILMVNLPGRV